MPVTSMTTSARRIRVGGWELHHHILRPSRCTLQRHNEHLLLAASHPDVVTFHLTGHAPTTDPPSTDATASVAIHRELLVAAEGPLRTLVAGPFKEGAKSEVTIHERKECWEVVKDFLNCQPVEMEKVPREMPLVADRWGLGVLFEAYFAHAEERARAHGDVGRMSVADLIRVYVPVMRIVLVPQRFKKYMALRLALEMDEVNKEFEAGGGGESVDDACCEMHAEGVMCRRRRKEKAEMEKERREREQRETNDMENEEKEEKEESKKEGDEEGSKESDTMKEGSNNGRDKEEDLKEGGKEDATKKYTGAGKVPNVVNADGGEGVSSSAKHDGAVPEVPAAKVADTQAQSLSSRGAASPDDLAKDRIDPNAEGATVPAASATSADASSSTQAEGLSAWSGESSRDTSQLVGSAEEALPDTTKHVLPVGEEPSNKNGGASQMNGVSADTKGSAGAAVPVLQTSGKLEAPRNDRPAASESAAEGNGTARNAEDAERSEETAATATVTSSKEGPATEDAEGGTGRAASSEADPKTGDKSVAESSGANAESPEAADSTATPPPPVSGTVEASIADKTSAKDGDADPTPGNTQDPDVSSSTPGGAATEMQLGVELDATERVVSGLAAAVDTTPESSPQGVIVHSAVTTADGSQSGATSVDQVVAPDSAANAIEALSVGPGTEAASTDAVTEGNVTGSEEVTAATENDEAGSDAENEIENDGDGDADAGSDAGSAAGSNASSVRSSLVDFSQPSPTLESQTYEWHKTFDIWNVFHEQKMMRHVVHYMSYYGPQNYSPLLLDVILRQLEPSLGDDEIVELLLALDWDWEGPRAEILKSESTKKWHARAWRLLVLAQIGCIESGTDVRMVWRYDDMFENMQAQAAAQSDKSSSADSDSNTHTSDEDNAAGFSKHWNGLVCCEGFQFTMSLCCGDPGAADVHPLYMKVRLVEREDLVITKEVSGREVSVRIRVVESGCGCDMANEDMLHGFIASPAQIGGGGTDTLNDFRNTGVTFTVMESKNFKKWIEKHTSKCGLVFQVRVYIFPVSDEERIAKYDRKTNESECGCNFCGCSDCDREGTKEIENGATESG